MSSQRKTENQLLPANFSAKFAVMAWKTGLLMKILQGFN